MDILYFGLYLYFWVCFWMDVCAVSIFMPDNISPLSGHVRLIFWGLWGLILWGSCCEPVMSHGVSYMRSHIVRFMLWAMLCLILWGMWGLILWGLILWGSCCEPCVVCSPQFPTGAKSQSSKDEIFSLNPFNIFTWALLAFSLGPCYILIWLLSPTHYWEQSP